MNEKAPYYTPEGKFDPVAHDKFLEERRTRDWAELEPQIELTDRIIGKVPDSEKQKLALEGLKKVCQSRFIGKNIREYLYEVRDFLKRNQLPENEIVIEAVAFLMGRGVVDEMGASNVINPMGFTSDVRQWVVQEGVEEGIRRMLQNPQLNEKLKARGEDVTVDKIVEEFGKFFRIPADRIADIRKGIESESGKV